MDMGTPKLAELETLHAVQTTSPQSMDDWEDYVSALSGEGLRSNVINANTQAFVNLMLDEGYRLAEIEAIMRKFVRRMAGLEMKIPEGGAFDLIQIYEEDPVAKTFAEEPFPS